MGKPQTEITQARRVLKRVNKALKRFDMDTQLLGNVTYRQLNAIKAALAEFADHLIGQYLDRQEPLQEPEVAKPVGRGTGAVIDRIAAEAEPAPKRRMSAAGRAAIAAGQQRRWAKAKRAKKQK